MSVVNSIINLFDSKRLHEIDLFRKNPLETQKEVLQNLLKKAKDTDFGKKYHFESITTEKEFRERVPLQRYEDFSIYVDRLKKGEKNILWPGEIKWFAKSSGTTNDKSKFIPVSKDSLLDIHYKGIRDVLTIFLKNNPDSKVFSGKTLTLGGSHKINKLNNNSYYGDLSAILLENAPLWSNHFKTPPAEIALIEDFEKKVEKIIEYSIHENVTAFAGVPSWYMVLFQRIIEHTGKKNINEVWPNMELFIHGGINFCPYREQYEKIIPSPRMKFMETYNASEGFFALQDEPDKTDMLLMLDYGIYYEFIPMDETLSKNSNALSLDEVETGKNYAMVISTNGGLWRYILGDTIKFTSTFPFKIKITGRTKQFINAFGEEIIVDNAEEALKAACNQTDAAIYEYSAGPIFMGDHNKGAHEWIIEFNKKPNDEAKFATVLDDTLKSLNSDYEAKRYKNITLDYPHVIVAPKGLFYEWMTLKKKTGGQNKVPRLSNNRKYLDELSNLIKKMHNSSR